MTSSNTRDTEQYGLLTGDSPVPAASPATSSFAARHRLGYQRVASVSFNDNPNTRDITDTAAEDEITPATDRNHGLGISSASSTQSQAHLQSPLRESYSNVESMPDNGAPVFSAPSTGAMSGSTRFDDSFDNSYKSQRMYKDSRTSLQFGHAPSVYAKSDAGLLSVRDKYNEFAPHQHCASKRTIKRGRCSWIPATIIFLAVFSTVFSAFFLGIALKQPRYGRFIRRGGSLTPSSAAFLTSLFAKLIELSFVTVVVAFIGQALARRAFKLERARGVTLAEMSMRTWVMQPGVMLTNWESVRYAGISILGVIAFLAALLGILYTSAATALVQPQLVLPGFTTMTMQGKVFTKFANSYYIADNCKTPITKQMDPVNKGTTCLQIQHNAMAFPNYEGYLSTWNDAVSVYGNSTNDLATRPKGYAIYSDNTTITAPWIERNPAHRPRPADGFLINNVTMAMPHIGVIKAAMDPINGLIQPWEVDGAAYNIRASVPSPMINVLCATLNEDQTKPFVYQQWESRNRNACNETSWLDWPACLKDGDRPYPQLNLTSDKFYEIFRWGDNWGPYRPPPIFPKLPEKDNMLVNDTRNMGWGFTTVYTLGRAGDGSEAAGNYSLCQMQVGQTARCQTHYNATGSGAQMEAVCETDDWLQFDRSVPAALDGNVTLSPEWVNIASEWMHSLSLNSGIFNGNASNCRLLTQFTLSSEDDGNLNRALPSTAEALAVLAGNTLIQSSLDAPFYMYWDHPLPTLEAGTYQGFNASVRVQQYASGGSQAYQKPFYVVLVVVFLMNVLILAYFIIHRDWYTDFSEPMNLFSLAVNSPPSEELAGSCGAGPTGDQYKVSWKMHKDGEHFYVESQEKNVDIMNVDSPKLSRKKWSQTFEMVGSPVNAMKRFSQHL